MPAPPPIILASGSQARIAMLSAAGLRFTAEAAAIDERALEAPLLAAGTEPADIATALAEAKATDVSSRHRTAVVIGSDQVLELDGKRWVKPASREEARAQLRRLGGRAHHLHAAVAIARDGKVTWRHRDTATMTMRPLDDAALTGYLDSVGDKVTGSVGAYQLEGPGVRLFEKIGGDYFTILGMPLLPLLAELRRVEAIPW